MPSVWKAMYVGRKKSEVVLSDNRAVEQGMVIFFAETHWRISYVTEVQEGTVVGLWPEDSHDVAPLYARETHQTVPELPSPDRLDG